MSYSDKLAKLQELRAEVRRLERQAEAEAKSLSPLSEDQERRMYADQADFDPAYVSAGRRAPPPMAHERPEPYRRRLAEGLQSYSDRWRAANLNSMADEVFAIAAAQIRADATANAKNAGLQARQIKEFVSRTPAGHTEVTFRGGPEAHFTQAFARPARRCLFKQPEAYQAMTQASMMQGIVNAGRRPTVQSPRHSF
jgi:hypothetical protein